MNWLRTAYRLFSFLDAVYFVGNFLYRRSLRYTIATAVISLLGYLGNIIPGVETYDARVAVFMPLCVGTVMLLGGLLLKLISLLFKSHLLNVAQAADLDLMENYRKWNQEAHLESLWNRVYRFEWQLGSHSTRVRPHPAECPAELCSLQGLPNDASERGKIQFLRVARFGLARPQSEPRQRYYLGIDLRFLEDWYNGGYFDPNDLKLDEQQAAAVPLRIVRSFVRYDIWDSLHDIPLRLSAKIWFRLITRAMALRLGESVLKLNREFNTDYFNVQALLWPEEHDEHWVAALGPGAREAVLGERARILRCVFHDHAEGLRMIDRFLGPLFLFATDLRARFDPEYLDGSLGYDVWSDLKWVGFPRYKQMYFVRLIQRAAHERWLIDQVLASPEMADLTPHPVANKNQEAYRTIRIATFISWERLGTIIRKWIRKGGRRGRLTDMLRNKLQSAIDECDRFTTYLVAIRVHHELTRLHRATYHQLLSDLFKTCEGVRTDALARGTNCHRRTLKA
ncbi:MAG: hypothetical protein ACUVQG_08675 [Thermogutta sp.]